MATSNDFYLYVKECLKDIPGISYRRMMGEYIIYKNNIVIGGLYDNRFLLKKTPSIACRGYREEIPYPGAKAMLKVDFEDNELIEEIIDLVYRDLL